MPRRPDGTTARTELLKLRLTPEGLAALDQARGEVSRSAFVRAAVAAQVRRLSVAVTETETVEPVVEVAVPAPAPGPERSAEPGPAGGQVSVGGRRLGHPFAPFAAGSLVCKCGSPVRYH